MVTLTPPEAPARTSRRWPLDTFRALQHRNYRLYFSGQIVSMTGSWVQTAALTWLAYHLTGKSRWAALVSAAQVAPTLLLGVYGGSLADRWPRRALIFLTQLTFLVIALVLAGMASFDMATGWGLLLVGLFIGVVNAVDTPARLAFVIDLVGREDLMNAVALNSLVFNVARAVGPAISGALLPWLGAGPCFLLNGLTFVAVLVALACMHLPAQASGATRQPPGSTPDAFRYLAGRRELVLLLVLAGVVAFFGWPLLSLLPALSDQYLLAGEKGYAWMLSGVGAGALLAALATASFVTEQRRVLFLGAGVVLSSASLIVLSFVPGLLLAVVCCGLLGGGLILFFVTGQAMMQLGADEHNRGRIMGVWLAVLSGAHPAGHLLAGEAADLWGVPLVLGLQGAGIASAVVVAFLVMLAFGDEAEE